MLNSQSLYDVLSTRLLDSFQEIITMCLAPSDVSYRSKPAECFEVTPIINNNFLSRKETLASSDTLVEEEDMLEHWNQADQTICKNN